MEINRDRAWRRAQKSTKRHKNSGKSVTDWPAEKKWNLLYLRAVKLHRAKQLGCDYPKCTLRQKLDIELPLSD